MWRRNEREEGVFLRNEKEREANHSEEGEEVEVEEEMWSSFGMRAEEIRGLQGCCVGGVR